MAVREKKHRVENPKAADAVRKITRHVENSEFRCNERAAMAVREKNRRVENPEFRSNEKAANAVRKTTRHVKNPELRRNERAATAVREKSIVWKIQNSDEMNEPLRLSEKKASCGKPRI